MLVAADGSDPEPWARSKDGSETGLSNVVSDIQSVVIAVAKDGSTTSKEIKYGPVITVKPKG